MMNKSNVNTKQEHAITRVEGFGFWVALWGLFVSILAQVITAAPVSQYIGEAFVLFSLTIYYAVRSLRLGLWGRQSNPSVKENLLTSLATAVTVALASFFLTAQNGNKLYTLKIVGSSSVCSFVMCFSIFSVFSKIYNKRRQKLDEVSID